jgi:cytochrome c
MKTMPVIFAAIASLAAGFGFAQSGADVVKSKGCLGCHDAEVKKVGPPFKATAAKYQGDKTAEARLVGVLKEGKGHPKIMATDAELKAAVGHVLATK